MTIDYANAVISILDSHLAERGIIIPNPEKDDYEKDDPYDTIANIFGTDYYNLEDEIKTAETVDQVMTIFNNFLEDKHINLTENNLRAKILQFADKHPDVLRC